MLLTRLSAGRFNLVIIFRRRPDLPAEPQIQTLRYTMIPANCVDKSKGLEKANNSFTEVDLPANVRQHNNNSWNGRVVYWFSKTNMINWLLHVLTEINSSTLCSKRQLISASNMRVCAAAERWTHLFSLKFIYFSVISRAKDLALVTMTIFNPAQGAVVQTRKSQARTSLSETIRCVIEECFWFSSCYKNKKVSKVHSVKIELFNPHVQIKQIRFFYG